MYFFIRANFTTEWHGEARDKKLLTLVFPAPVIRITASVADRVLWGLKGFQHAVFFIFIVLCIKPGEKDWTTLKLSQTAINRELLYLLLTLVLVINLVFLILCTSAHLGVIRHRSVSLTQPILCVWNKKVIIWLYTMRGIRSWVTSSFKKARIWYYLF